MVNRFSPALDYFPLEPIAAPTPPPPVRYPSVPPAVRFLSTGLRVLHRLSPSLALTAMWRLFRTPRRLAARPWEATALTEAKAFPLRLSTGRRVMAYEWPAAPGAPAVALFHGWEHRATFWREFVPALRAAGYRVLALDGPAHGASDGRRTVLPEYAEAVRSLLAHAGEVHAVVAHSFGAAAVAAQPLLSGTVPAMPRLVMLGAPGSLRAIAERFVHMLRLPTSLVDQLSARIRQRFGHEMEAYSLQRQGPHLPVGRALLVHDEHDEFVPFIEAQRVAQAWPALQLHTTVGLGHNGLLRNAGVVERVRDFLLTD